MRITTLTLAVALQASMSLAASFPTSISRQPLRVRPPSERLSVGLNVEEIERSIDMDEGDDDVLSASSASIYVGYDILHWFTAFLTLGASEVDADSDSDEDSSAGLKVSTGVSAYLWEVDVLEPSFMAGRFSFKPTLELSRYAADSSDGDSSWFDLTVALPLGYEMFDRHPVSSEGVDTSLALYAGPAVSYMFGSVGSGAGDGDFVGDDVFGFIGGVDLFLAPTVSLGAEFSFFGETSIMGSLRFHL
ncbi:MAG: hypothetical protein HN341_01515 [Verrucomicrobia bacterium]|jgi:hypothetical protein|nr:hypothetical protein [Verrucomicrobiota bacterium]